MLNLFTLILQIAVVLVAARIFGILFHSIGQPRVVGEMAAGIFLGPSFLGWMAPALSAAIFPPASLGFLNALSQVGLVLFMFLVGLSLNPSELKGLGNAALLTSHVSIAVPFVMGSVLAYFLYPLFSNDSVTFLSFALFIGAAMSITAFPVLARILTERNLLNTRLGAITISCAAVDDVTGWCVLAGIVVLIRAHNTETPLWLTIAGTLIFALLVIFAVRPLLRGFEKSYRRRGLLSDDSIALMVLLVLVSALVTERLGVHLLFGAFLLGAVMPKDRRFVQHIQDKFESVTVIVLLPLFFAFSGLRTSIGQITGKQMWIYCALIIFVAVAGKLGGSLVAARTAGMSWREATGIGILMNTRGLMELVILNIGLDIKVISPAIFSMMVMMALVTTFMTTPLLALVCPGSWLRARQPAAVAERASA